MYRVIVSVALAVGAMSGPAAFAQTEDAIPAPAEVPPADYDAASYVDSRGCAYARAAVNGAVTWVPQLGADRKPLCGLPPSLPPPPKAEVAPATAGGQPEVAARATVAQDVPAAEVPPEPAAMPAEAVPAKPAAKATAPRKTKAPVGHKSAAPKVVRTLPPTAIVKRDGLWRQVEILAKVQGDQATPSGIFVQVGAYGRTANADIARDTLRAAGLPVAGATAHKQGTPLYLVLTGPFPDAHAAQDGLRRARAAGFADAFIY